MTKLLTALAPPLPERATRNHLLAALPPDEYARIARDLTNVPIAVGQVLHTRGLPTAHVYFPNGGVCSIVTTMHDGTSAEVASVGAEGTTGVHALIDGSSGTDTETVARVRNTTAECMPLIAFRRELERGGALHAAVAQ